MFVMCYMANSFVQCEHWSLFYHTVLVHTTHERIYIQFVLVSGGGVVVVVVIGCCLAVDKHELFKFQGVICRIKIYVIIYCEVFKAQKHEEHRQVCWHCLSKYINALLRKYVGMHAIWRTVIKDSTEVTSDIFNKI